MKSGCVSFIGRPNAGKSTLLNRLVGTKLAIVSDKPQTTRTRILGVRNYPGAQVVFLDTPGIHRPLHRMNVRMVHAALDTIREVDVLGLVVDVVEPPGKGDRYVLDLIRSVKVPVFLILNKIDLIKRVRLLPVIDRLRQQAAFAEIVPVSAGTGENVDRLERLLVDRLPEGEPLYADDYLTDRPERFFAAEIVREKVLQFTRAEIPFASAVVVDRFEEAGDVGGETGVDAGEEAVGLQPGGAVGTRREKDLLRLYCSIVVERESQKPIVIGRGGDMIKRIGIAAREDLERFFGTRVYLDLRVRVRAEWRENDHVLDDIGLGPGGDRGAD
jgi:GTP-binding protein Era